MSEQILKSRIKEDELRIKEIRICSCRFSIGKPNDIRGSKKRSCPFKN